MAIEKPNQQTAMEVLLAGVFVLSLWKRKINVFDPKRTPSEPPFPTRLPCRYPIKGEEANLGSSGKTVLPARLYCRLEGRGEMNPSFASYS